MHLIQKARLRPEILSALGPNPAWTRPEKPGPSYNSGLATETVDLGSIPGPVNPQTKKLGIHNFSTLSSTIKGLVWSFHRVW